MLQSPTRAMLMAAQLDVAWDGTAGPAEVVTLTYVRIISRPRGVTKLPIAHVWRDLGDFLLCRVHRRYGVSVYLHPRW